MSANGKFYSSKIPESAYMIIRTWREMPVHDAICCDEARKAAGAYCGQLSQHPESLTQIMKNILEELPSSSCTPLIIRKNKRSDISVSLQTLLSVIFSQFKLIISSPEILEISFRKINFGDNRSCGSSNAIASRQANVYSHFFEGLVQLLEDGASESGCFLLHNDHSYFWTVFCSSSALSAFHLYFSSNEAHF